MLMNWRTELEQMLLDNEDELEVLVVKSENRPMRPIAVPIDYGVFDREFDGGYGGSEGCSFTAWGGKYVYFPAVYDGSEWIECVPRNPCLIATTHIGGQ
jgi:hypothetical protein